MAKVDFFCVVKHVLLSGFGVGGLQNLLEGGEGGWVQNPQITLPKATGLDWLILASMI